MRNNFWKMCTILCCICSMESPEQNGKCLNHAWDFDQSTSFVIFSRQLSYLEEVLDILLKDTCKEVWRRSLDPQLLLWIFCREIRAWLAEFHPLSTSTQEKKDPALKCGSLLQAGTEQIPVPQKQHVQKTQRKELFGYAFISKLNRPWAAGQSTWCACILPVKLSFSFSLKSLVLSLISTGGKSMICATPKLYAGIGWCSYVCYRSKLPEFTNTQVMMKFLNQNSGTSYSTTLCGWCDGSALTVDAQMLAA